MGQTTAMVSVEEYLRTSYSDGDREYVDGEVRERNLGEFDHSEIQSELSHLIRARYPQYWAGVEMRVQVKATRFRIPDVTVMPAGWRRSRIVKEPPLLLVEVLSPDDTVSDLEEKLDDYFAFGAPCVWVINPRRRTVRIHTPESMREVRDGDLTTPDGAISLPLAEVLANILGE